MVLMSQLLLQKLHEWGEERIVSEPMIRREGRWCRCFGSRACICLCVWMRARAQWRRRRVRTLVDGMGTGRWRLFLECGSPINPSLSCDVTGSSSWQQGCQVNYLWFRGSSLSSSLPPSLYLPISPFFLLPFPQSSRARHVQPGRPTLRAFYLWSPPIRGGIG